MTEQALISKEEWIKQNSLFAKIVNKENVFWVNPELKTENQPNQEFSSLDIEDAESRLNRFKPYIAQAFPETASADGEIESPLHNAHNLKAHLEKMWNIKLGSNLFLKLDSHLPISGSIKARGGIYEVLKHAESLALKNKLISLNDNYSKLYSPKCREFFANYSIAVGSTGNLGLSIGIISAKLGFKVTVHMSSDARQWKKDMLRSKGVTVVEYASDYSTAVAIGRSLAKADPNCHFVDDEDSRDLFLGYSVAGKRIAKQLEENNVVVDKEHPLFVYLPCGVGGGPGGVCFGLKQLFGDNVHCFFAEPALAPAVILGLMTGLDEQADSHWFGLDNKSLADGLAVGQPSGLVCRAMRPILDGCFTMQDDELFKNLAIVNQKENLHLEPSALAGLSGLEQVVTNENYKAMPLHQATHIVWCTGGSMVPKAEWNAYNEKGLELLSMQK